MSSALLDEQVNVSFDTSTSACGDDLSTDDSNDFERLGGCMKREVAIQCGKILHGSWVVFENFVVDKLETCGLSNYLYVAKLKKTVLPVPDEPRTVLVRVYGEGLRSSCHSMISDAISFTLLSEKGIGPRLHGIFSGGRIEEYIQSRTLTCNELSLPKVSRTVACHMARIHKLNMPFSKEPTALFKMIDKFLAEITNGEADTAIGLRRDVNLSSASLTALEREIDAKDSSAKANFVKAAGLLNQLNIYEEYAWVRSQLVNGPGSSSPTVFCHNDLQENNILLLNEPVQDEPYNLLMIDFEYSRYNYRAFDVGNYFNEWCFSYSMQDPPYFTYDFTKYPTASEQATFWSSYLTAYRSGADESGSASPLLSSVSTSSSPPLILPPADLKEDAISFSEAETYKLWLEAILGALYSNLFWTVWSLRQSTMSKIKFDFCAHAVSRMDAYRRLKQEFLAGYQNGITTECNDENMSISTHQNGE